MGKGGTGTPPPGGEIQSNWPMGKEMSGIFFLLISAFNLLLSILFTICSLQTAGVHLVRACTNMPVAKNKTNPQDHKLNKKEKENMKAFTSVM